MTVPRLLDGDILLDGGAWAISDDCCCGTECTKDIVITGYGTALAPGFFCSAGTCPDILGTYNAANCNASAVTKTDFFSFICTYGGNDYYYWMVLEDIAPGSETGELDIYAGTYSQTAGGPAPTSVAGYPGTNKRHIVYHWNGSDWVIDSDVLSGFVEGCELDCYVITIGSAATAPCP